MRRSRALLGGRKTGFAAILEGVIHKPRGQLRGRGFGQISILLHKPYFVKVTTKEEGGGGVKIPKILITWFVDDPL